MRRRHFLVVGLRVAARRACSQFLVGIDGRPTRTGLVLGLERADRRQLCERAGLALVAVSEIHHVLSLFGALLLPGLLLAGRVAFRLLLTGCAGRFCVHETSNVIVVCLGPTSSANVSSPKVKCCGVSSAMMPRACSTSPSAFSSGARKLPSSRRRRCGKRS